MLVRRLCASLAPALIVGFPADSTAVQVEWNPEVSEIRIQVDDASLYSRVIGHGLPVIVLHGGPDFDHSYLLPELDEWKDVRFYMPRSSSGISTGTPGISSNSSIGVSLTPSNRSATAAAEWVSCTV